MVELLKKLVLTNFMLFISFDSGGSDKFLRLLVGLLIALLSLALRLQTQCETCCKSCSGLRR